MSVCGGGIGQKGKQARSHPGTEEKAGDMCQYSHFPSVCGKLAG